jgi:RimJ/RimL family protein N-acetyltransferase
VHPAHDRWQEPVFRAYFADALASGGGLTILDKATGAIIGASRYACHDPARDEVEIGWTFISRAYWGGVYNREIKRLMLDHIHLYVGTALFAVGENNLRSRRAMEKLGGVLQEGRTDRGDGVVLPAYVYYTIARP